MIVDLMEESLQEGTNRDVLKLMEEFELARHPASKSTARIIIESIATLDAMVGRCEWAIRVIPPEDHECSQHLQIEFTPRAVVQYFKGGSVDLQETGIDPEEWTYFLMWNAECASEMRVKAGMGDNWEAVGDAIEDQGYMQIPFECSSDLPDGDKLVDPVSTELRDLIPDWLDH